MFPFWELELTLLLSRSLKLAFLGLALTAPVLLTGCDRQSDKAAQPAAAAKADRGAEASTAAGESGTALDRSHKGSQLPDMTLADIAGKKLNLASLKGKPLLINLWATWCAPCVAELPQLDRLAASGRLKVLTVSQDSGKPEEVAKFLKDRGVTRLEPWLDPENNLIAQYNAGTLPTSVLYDATGREVWRFVGPRDWESPETAALLAEAG